MLTKEKENYFLRQGTFRMGIKTFAGIELDIMEMEKKGLEIPDIWKNQ